MIKNPGADLPPPLQLGLTVDIMILQELAKVVKFKYKFQLEPNGAYGKFKDGKWNGMIAELR